MYSGNNITGDGVCLAVQAAGIGDKIVSVAVDSDDTEMLRLEMVPWMQSLSRMHTHRATSAWKMPFRR